MTNRHGKNFAAALNRAFVEKQKIYLQEAQGVLDCGPTEMARALGTNYNTYKAWLYGVNPLPGVARVAIDCLIRNRPK